MTPVECTVRVTPNNAPAEKITVHFAGAELTMSAFQVAELLIDKVRAGHAAPATLYAQKIGAAWPEQGGIYVGIGPGRDGAPDHHLVVAETEREDISWDDAMSWALGHTVGAHHDFTLPTRSDQALLYANVPELFRPTWYWSSAQNADVAGYAWSQSFSDGYQYDSLKSSSLRARAVRRISIQ